MKRTVYDFRLLKRIKKCPICEKNKPVIFAFFEDEPSKMMLYCKECFLKESDYSLKKCFTCKNVEQCTLKKVLFTRRELKMLKKDMLIIP